MQVAPQSTAPHGRGSVARIAILLAASALTAHPQQVSVPFSGGSRPQTLRITLHNGGVELHGYDGKEVIFDSGGSGKHKDKSRSGTRPIDIANGYSLTEDNNLITIHGAGGGSPRMNLRVPFNTNLEIKCTNCGETGISDIAGDIDVNVTNGGIRLVNTTGAVLAHSLNSRVFATFAKPPQKPVSLSTLNGGLDVTVPPDTKANLNLKTTNGKIYSDFDVRLAGGTLMQPGKGLSGTINGGGVELRLNSFNGSIYLRRK